MSMQSYKVQFNDQIRRISLPFDCTYPQLRKKLQEIFPDVQSAFQLSYTDEENDRISVNSQFELDEAKRLNKTMIRLSIDSRQKKSQPQANISLNPSNSSAENTRPSLSSSSASALAQNSLVQTLLFIQPFVTNPQLLKTVLPLFLSELNKNNFLAQEDLAKVNQHLNQILDYPFVQEFLTKHLPKILHQIVGSEPPTPAPPAQIPVSSPQKPPTEQLYDLFKPFVSFAQNLAQNVSLPTVPSIDIQSRSSSRSSSSVEPLPMDVDIPKSQYQPATEYIYAASPSIQPQVNPIPNVNESPAVPTAQSQKRTPTIFMRELAQLKELGFPESNSLIELLNQSNGDVSAVIDAFY